MGGTGKARGMSGFRQATETNGERQERKREKKREEEGWSGPAGGIWEEKRNGPFSIDFVACYIIR